MRKIFLTLSVYLFFTSSAWAYNPPDVVYRLDLRGPEIIGQIGFQPRTNGPGSNRNMIPHIDGSSLVNQTSSLVSTSASVGQAVNHIRAFGLIDPETETYSSEHVFYLYSIRPSDEFYDVRHTLETASATPDAPDRSPNFIHQRQALLDRANFFDDADEVIATQGIGPDRILAYAEVTGTMLNDDHWFRRMWE
ncbi:MAG: hypothetical protein JHC61_07910, partial [Burkholderiaceae bacterium]|nr:hypothetical protein [Burkholderiaceae bacterium]